MPGKRAEFALQCVRRIHKFEPASRRRLVPEVKDGPHRLDRGLGVLQPAASATFMDGCVALLEEEGLQSVRFGWLLGTTSRTYTRGSATR